MTTTFLSPVALPYIAHIYTNAGVFKKSTKILNHPSLSWAVNSTGFDVNLDMPSANSAPLTTQGDIFKLTEDGGDGSVLYTGIVEDLPDNIDQTVEHSINLVPLGVELADTLFSHNYSSLTDIGQMIRDALAVCTHCTATTATVPDTGITRIYNFVDKHPLDVLQTAAKMAGPSFVWIVDEIGQVFFGPSGILGFPGTDFETDSDWVINNTGTGLATIDATTPHTGAKALKLTNPSSGNYGGVYNKRGIPVSGLVNLPLTAWIKGSASGVFSSISGGIRICFANPGANVSSDGIASAQPSSQGSTSSSDWRPTVTASYALYSTSVSVPAGYQWAFLEIYNNGTGTNTPVFVDDITPARGKVYSVRTRVDAPARKITAPITNLKNYIKGYGAILPNTTTPITAVYDQTSGSPYNARALDPITFPNLTDQNTLQSIVNTIGSVLNRPLTTVVLRLPFHNDNGVGERINLARVGGACIRYFEPSQDDLAETDPGIGSYSLVYMIVQVDIDGPEQVITARSVALNVDDFVNEINDNLSRIQTDSPSPVSLPITPGQIVNSTTGGPSAPSTPAFSFVDWSTDLDEIAQVNNAYVIVKWTPNATNENVARYEIRYSKNNDGNFAFVSVVAGTVDGGGKGYAKISGLIPGTSYTFELRAYNILGAVSAWNTPQAILTQNDSDAPNIPTGLSAARGPRGAIVSWDANVEADLQGYQLQVSIDGGDYQDVTPGPTHATIINYVAPTGTEQGTPLSFQVQAVDWSGNESGYSAVPATVDTDAIFASDIAANAIVAEKIAAGAITADKLEATLILASVIRAGTGVQGVVFDVNGIRAYNATGDIVVNIPDDGSPVTINAKVIAQILSVTGNAVLQGSNNELAFGALLQLDSSQGNPAQAPSIASSFDGVSLPVDATYDKSSVIYARTGLDYDSAGGAGGATKCFWQATNKGDGTTEFLLELLASNRSANRVIAIGPGGVNGINPISICRLGSYVYLLSLDKSAGVGGSGTTGYTAAATFSYNFSGANTDDQVAMLITMPNDGTAISYTIKQVTIAFGGHGGSTTGGAAIYNSSGTYLAGSNSASIPSGHAARTFTLAVPLVVAPGTQLYVGGYRTSSLHGEWGVTSSGNFYKKQTNPAPGNGAFAAAGGGYVNGNMQAYVHWDKNTTVSSYVVRRYSQSALTLDATYSSVDFPITPVSPVMTDDGTNIYIVDRSTTIKWNKYDATMVKQGLTIDTTYNPGGAVTACAAGNFDFGAFRIAVANNSASGIIDTFDSIGVRQANEAFPFPGLATYGITYGDALADGARFWSLPVTSSAVNLTKHSTWTWTTASSVYWVAYSWYDDVGTAHETQVGPRSSITMGRRKLLTITSQVLPGSGGADDPDKIRFYMAPNATDPGIGALKLQATQAAVTVVLTGYNSGGAADPASNNFPAGGPAIVQSQVSPASGGWKAKGDGVTSFPQVIDVQTPVGVSSFDFPNPLPTNFAMLEILWQAREDGAVATDFLKIRFNNDSGNNYYRERAGWNGSSIASAELLTQNYAEGGELTGASIADTGLAGHGRIFIVNYTDTHFKKQWHGFASLATALTTTLIQGFIPSGVWNNTGAITRITVFAGTGNFIAGSKFILIGYPLVVP